MYVFMCVVLSGIAVRGANTRNTPRSIGKKVAGSRFWGAVKWSIDMYLFVKFVTLVGNSLVCKTILLLDLFVTLVGNSVNTCW